MDQPKIERMLRLMQMMSGSVDYSTNELALKLELSYRSIYRYIDSFKQAGFVVTKKAGGVYKLCRMPRNGMDINKFVYFSEEEAGMIASLIESLDNGNALKEELHRKLATVYNSTSIADYISDKNRSANIEVIGEAIRNHKRVILKDYESASSHTKRDRRIEPFAFSTNFVDVWGYDVDIPDNRVFKISRISQVERTEEDWSCEEKHRKGEMDCFRMQGKDKYHIRLKLGLRAKNLLLEEYPLAKKYLLEEKDGTWILDTEICGLNGAGRFVIGISDEIEILQGEELNLYIQEFAKKYIIKDF